MVASDWRLCGINLSKHLLILHAVYYISFPRLLDKLLLKYLHHVKLNSYESSNASVFDEPSKTVIVVPFQPISSIVTWSALQFVSRGKKKARNETK
jgi:hypothetical protein